MTGRRHAPVRTCIGCGDHGPQSTLIRIVRDPDGRLRVDPDRRAAGRGGYLHSDRNCWGRFSRRKGVIRSWRATVDRSARAALVEELESSGV